MKSPPPVPPPPPSYQESLKKIQNATNFDTSLHINENNNRNDSHAYICSDVKFSHFNNNQNNLTASQMKPNTELNANAVSSSSYEMNNFLKQQQNINANSNKRDLSQYLNSHQSYKAGSPQSSQFLQNNSNFIHNNSNNNKNYSSSKKSVSNFTSDIEKELSDLTLTIEREMERQFEDSQKQQSEYFGLCDKCNKGVFGRKDACHAQDKIYHNQCFTCIQCCRTLRGKSFYNVNNHIYCEEDYLYSGFLENAEKCNVCGQIIVDVILQAVGKSFHPNCFRCHSCSECLDGVPFTLDINNHFYCVNDYYKKYSPQCEACNQAIIPTEGSNETVRVVSMDKNYHIGCYVCKGCGIQLTDEYENRCFPYGSNLFCYNCYMNNFDVQ